MKLNELAEALGIVRDVSHLEDTWAHLDRTDLSVCDVRRIRALEEKYCFLEEFYELTLAAAEGLAKDPLRLAWAQLLSQFNRTVGEEQARRSPVPDSDGTPAGDLLPLLVHLTELEDMVARYRARGLSEEEIRHELGIFARSLRIMILNCSRPMFNQTYYGWCLFYIKATIFACGALEFQIYNWDKDAIVLRHKTTGEKRILLTAGRVHKSGIPLGSAGCTDARGAFDICFLETEDAWIGHACPDFRIDSFQTKYKKSEWECILRRGDAVINLHIPRDADLTPERITKDLAEGIARARKYFPECDLRGTVCDSWLLSPALPKILGENSKITKFARRFLTFPRVSAATSCFTFAFPGFCGEYAELPEDTSLRRGLKALYLSGGYAYEAPGVLWEEY